MSPTLRFLQSTGWRKKLIYRSYGIGAYYFISNKSTIPSAAWRTSPNKSTIPSAAWRKSPNRPHTGHMTVVDQFNQIPDPVGGVVDKSQQVHDPVGGEADLSHDRTTIVTHEGNMVVTNPWKRLAKLSSSHCRLWRSRFLNT